MVSTTMSNPQTFQSTVGKKVNAIGTKHHSAKFSRPSHDKSPKSVTNDEIKSLRARNKVLEAAMSSIKTCADEHFDKHYDLVWFAMNRCRYPNHEKSKELENSKEYSAEIEKLRGGNCDYFHGVNCGAFATSRLFKEIADVASFALDKTENDEARRTEESTVVIEQKVQDAKKSFPNLELE